MLAQNSAKRVTLRGKVSRETLPAVREWTELGGTVSFLYSGDMNELIRTLAKEEVEDLTIAEPDLEEIFLHFYGKGGDQA
jgi:ABC-2 type transport system ATP-binding protein